MIIVEKPTMHWEIMKIIDRSMAFPKGLFWVVRNFLTERSKSRTAWWCRPWPSRGIARRYSARPNRHRARIGPSRGGRAHVGPPNLGICCVWPWGVRQAWESRGMGWVTLSVRDWQASYLPTDYPQLPYPSVPDTRKSRDLVGPHASRGPNHRSVSNWAGPVIDFPIIFNFSMEFIEFLIISIAFNFSHWFLNDSHCFPIVFNDFHCFPIVFHEPLHNFHGDPWSSNDCPLCQWFSLMF